MLNYAYYKLWIDWLVMQHKLNKTNSIGKITTTADRPIIDQWLLKLYVNFDEYFWDSFLTNTLL